MAAAEELSLRRALQISCFRRISRISGMLGRAPAANLPALGTQAKAFVSAGGRKRFCKAWPRGVDLLAEPTSVLDIRSPSPSSTLSSSVAASSESGVQGSSESGGAVAVSGRAYESSEGQLVDCTSLLEGGGNEDGSVWGLESVEDGGAGQAMAGILQSNPGEMQRGWDRNVDGNCRQYADGIASSIKEVVPGYGNEGTALNSGFMQVLGMPQEKQDMALGKEGGHKPERVSLVSSGVALPAKDAVQQMAVKREARGGDESLEACVLSCRKREREDSLGEVVQRLCVQKIEAGEWLSDWTEFGDNAGVTVEGKAAAPSLPPPCPLEDLDDIFNCSPSVAQPEFWLNESLPLMQQQHVHHHGDAGSNPQSSGKVQLDLFEAVQAGLLLKGGNNGGSGLSRSIASSPFPAIISPSMQVLPRSFSAAPQASPLIRAFSKGGLPSVLPLHRHLLGDSTSRAPAFLPEFLGRRPSSPASRLLNAAFAPAPPHFASQVQLQDLPFPLPAPVKKAAPALQPNFFAFPAADFRPLKGADFPDRKPWQLSSNERDPSSKVIPGGLKWQLKPETGWEPPDRLGAGHSQGANLSSLLPLPADRAPLCQATGPEHVGRCVRLEELSLAERLLCAASEAAQLGDLSSAQAILARLNHPSSPNGQQQRQLAPAQRVALLFGEALSKWVAAASSSPVSYHLQQSLFSNSTLDLINKISAFKKFCEVSPISQFSHFTANQAILDAMEGEDFVHVVDFELGFGGQWASFMQEISQRSRGPPELKITSMGTDTLEMRLVKENLLQFAKEVGMKLEVNVVPGQKLEGLKAMLANKSEKEAIAINFGFGMNRLVSDFSASTEEVFEFLQMVRELCPKVVAVVDCECEFEGPSAYMNALQFYACVFESLESSTKLSAEVVRSIESFVFGPKISDLVNARRVHKSPSENGLPPWRILLQKVGFTSFPFSNAAESQASWLVKSPLNNGFTFLKQQATLLLAWYSRTLVSSSAWV